MAALMPKRILRVLVSTCFVVFGSFNGVAADSAPRNGPALSPDLIYDFALIGDVPYDETQITRSFPNMIEELNQEKLVFVVHDGDIKAGATPCSDVVFERVYSLFETIRHPLIYTPGDNEWSDCGQVRTNSYDPLDRLQKLRTLFHSGSQSLGQRKLNLTRQSDAGEFGEFRENVRWLHGGILFATLNAPGSDNFAGSKEFDRRNTANLAWIHDAFAIAQRENLRAVMIIMQANPHFDLPSTNRVRRGFNAMIKAFEEEALEFAKPVVLVHGDTHYFRIDQPLMSARGRRIENFTRVETYGNPDMHWLKVHVDWRNPNVFQFQPRIVKPNLARHRG